MDAFKYHWVALNLLFIWMNVLVRYNKIINEIFFVYRYEVLNTAESKQKQSKSLADLLDMVSLSWYILNE